MVFYTPQRRVNYPTLKLNNAIIEKVSQCNFIGVVLASTLKWDKHIRHVSLINSFKSNWCIIQIKAYLSTEGVTNSV